MESLILSTLQACQSVSRASALTGVSWDRVQGVMERAVQRGQKRKQQTPETSQPTHMGVEEKAFRKGHTYLTIACDLDRGTVEHVAEDRQTDSLARYFRGLSGDQIESIQCIAMDMWQPYIRATHEHLPLAGEKIVFDQFHVMKLATTIKQHLNGILTCCKHGVTNGVSESINSTLMTIKRLVGGFRNPDNFKTAIYFHCGGLDLHPR